MVIDLFGDLRTIFKLRRFIKRLAKGDFVWMNPLFWPVFGWGLTAILTFGIAFWPSIHPGIGITLLMLAIALPNVGLLANFAFYSINKKYLRRLVLLYLSLMLIFANVYFLFLLLLDDGTVPFDGIHKVWTWLGGTRGGVIRPKDALLAIVDCIHFSIASITTLGYGDIVPIKWYSKLAADIEVLLGLGIVVVGIGRYFQGNKRNQNTS